jgi:hypothetical protein
MQSNRPVVIHFQHSPVVYIFILPLRLAGLLHDPVAWSVLFVMASRCESLQLKFTLNLNSVNQLIFVMVKYGVLFEVRTEFLNNI